ncbi:K02A2.6-like, partial [Cordylochernes scorpioides]
MANFGSIESFDPKKPEKWIVYLERMNFFFLANDIVKPERRKAIFLTLIGAETYALARSLASPKELSFVEYDDLIKLLTDHFCPRPNVIVQRYHFNKGNQGTESVSAYVAQLRKLSENCEFVDLDDRLRDQLVCGLRNESLVKRLLSEKDLTFEKAVNLAICDESASADASMLQEKITEVNMIKKTSKTEPPNFKSGKVHVKDFKKMNNKIIICIRCKGNHMPNVCKFRNAKCFKCGKIGHVQMACLTNVGKSGNLYRANSNPTLCCLRREEISNPYYITANLDNHDVHMLIDSGSEYSLLNKETFLEYWKLTQLKRSEILLNTWSSSQVKILGKLYVKARLSHGSRSLQILVADGLGPNILGRQWFSAFRLKLNFLNSLETNPISPDFEELFKEEIDAYNGPLIHIDIPDNAEPKFVKARTVPFAIRNLVDEKLKALEEQGIIEPIKFSKWASPIVTVLKNDGTIRICHDYKTTVNLYTNPDKYPLPTITQLLDRLRGGKVFTKLDMAQAYQQLKVDDESSEILTINTPRGLYRVKRLPFGLNSAVGTFQRFMDTLLMGIDGVAVYLDDVLIAGSNCEDLKKKTEKVLLRFKEAGLRLKRNKCKFYVPEIEFLGMKIDNKGIHPSEEKLRAIKDARPPSNKKELMSFLGLLNYHERFLRNKATVVEPLHRLLDSNNPWKWNREHQRAFKEAKSLISSESVLAHFDDNLPILVSCDASEYGIGAVLSQVDHEVERPVVFASRTLNKTERRYAVIDKEALAVNFGASKFSQYLLGRKFKILTDHKPLVGMFNPKKPIPQVLSPRMLRWCLTLAAYTYTIEYKPGKVNCNADALSRLPLNECPSVVPNPSEVFFIELEHAAINSSEVAKLTSKDPILSKVKFWAMNGWPERRVDDKFKDFVSKSSEISVHKDCLLWGSRVIIPERLRKDILNLLHDTHIGIVGTKALARGLCWSPKMDGDIERMISSCAVCLSCSHDPPKTDVYPWIWPSRPWSRLHIDHAGPFQGKLFLVVIDAYSKWIEAKIVSTTSTETTINSLKEIFATHGLPDVIVSDNGTSFTSELFRTFLKRNGVRHILCAPYHAASNGQVERAIQTLKNLLRKNGSGNWTTRLSRSLLSMRIAINSTTQKSPAQLLMNRNLKSLLNKFHPESVSEGRMRQENKFIRNWKPHRVVNEGQAVIARGYHGPRWLPGVVQEKTGPVSIKVETDDGDILNRHLDQVRGCGESEVTPSTSSTPKESTNIEDPQADQEMDPAGEASGPTLRRSSRLRRPSKFFEITCNNCPGVELTPTHIFSSPAMGTALQKIGMDPEQQLHTPKIENDCCDRDAWRNLRLFIGHDNNNRKLTWTQNSSFTHPKYRTTAVIEIQSYEEEFAKQLLETLIKDRERIEERERIEDRKRIEDRERKEQMVMEFELEKLRIQTTRGNNDTSRSTSNDAHYEIRKLMPKYESKDNDLSFYLILFERQAKRLGLDEDQWAFSLPGLLPYEMTQLIARETEEQSGDYRFVKRLLLKRYKLSPEQFRQKFEKHERSQKGSWRDFAFELRGYFNEWIEGMNVENFDALKDLSVTNQLKKKVPNVLRNHLIDDWTKLNNPDELADKLDEYENVRTEMGPPHWNAKHLIPPSFQQKSARFPNQSEVKETKQGTNVSGQDAARNEISETYPNTLRRMVNRTIRNDKGEPKCFNCNQFGHIARDCPAPRTTLTCRGCGQTGHKERNCTRPKEGLKVANLEVEGLETVPPDVYLKDVKIDNKETVKAMIDTGSSSCLMRESVARRISVDIEPDSTSLYGIGNQTAPAARTVGKTTVDLEIDGIVGREITVFIVNDDAQPYDLLIGRTWTDLPYVSFARIDGRRRQMALGLLCEQEDNRGREDVPLKQIRLMAIVWTLDRLRQFLVGIKFTVVTDCQALVYMNAKKTTNPQIARWYNLIQEYDFEIRHKPGEKMAHVDGMSRAPVDDPRDTMEEIVEKNLEVCLTITLEEQILMIQHSDPELRDLIQIFRKDPCDRTVGEQNRINDYSYKGGRLFRMVKNGEEERALYVIPKSMRKSLVVKFHDLMGHFATDRTVNKIKELYWFPSMKRYVRRHVAMCLECLFNKVPGGKQQGFLHPIKSGKRPFSIVHMDHVGPFVRSTKGNQELLVIVDNLTRFVRLSPVRNTSTQNVLKVMKSFVNDFGLPDKIISDRGSCFTSRQFEEFCRGNGIHHTLNSTKHPQGNGMVERVNRTVLSTIATSIEDPRRKDWDLKIKEVERDLNNVVNKTTNKTPFETLHGYSPRFHDGILRRLADEDVDPWTEPDRIQESVRSQIENKQEIMKTYYDKKRCRTIQFEKKLPYTVPNPVAAIETINNIPIPHDSYMVSFDIESLYTSIPHDAAILALQEFLHNHPEIILPIPKEALIDLIELCLALNYFGYKDRYFKQEKGLPMGNPVLSALANIYMDKIDKIIADTAQLQ